MFYRDLEFLVCVRKKFKGWILYANFTQYNVYMYGKLIFCDWLEKYDTIVSRRHRVVKSLTGRLKKLKFRKNGKIFEVYVYIPFRNTGTFQIHFEPFNHTK